MRQLRTEGSSRKFALTPPPADLRGSIKLEYIGEADARRGVGGFVVSPEGAEIDAFEGGMQER